MPDYSTLTNAELITELETRDATIVTKDSDIATLNQTVADKDTEISTLTQTVVDKDTLIATKDGQILTLTQDNDTKDGEILQLNAANEQLNTTITERETEISDMKKPDGVIQTLNDISDSEQRLLAHKIRTTKSGFAAYQKVITGISK